jgi:hypothetical protein
METQFGRLVLGKVKCALALGCVLMKGARGPTRELNSEQGLRGRS